MSAYAPIVSGPYEIAGRRIFPQRNEAFVNGERRRLEPRHMKVLQCLAQAAGDTVSREDLLDAGWGAQIVGDDSLTQAISRLRRALDDRPGEGRLIETLPKTGYRLTCAPAPAAACPPVSPVATGAPARSLTAIAAWARTHARAAAFAGVALASAAGLGWRAADAFFPAQPETAEAAPAQGAAPERRILVRRMYLAPGEPSPEIRPEMFDL